MSGTSGTGGRAGPGMTGARSSLISAACAALAASVLLAAGSALAEITSDHPAAILLFPKVVVHTGGEGGRLDTFITISNTSTRPINVLCYYVNATPLCDNNDGVCFPERTCTGNCEPRWQQTDFRFRLTREQPTGWLASVGAGVGCNRLGRCSDDGVTTCVDRQDCNAGARCVVPPCLPLDGDPGGRGFNGETNGNSLIPPTAEDPFIGELKCIAVDATGAPTDRNDLIGHALIGQVDRDGNFVDVAGYNPLGFPAIEGANNRNQVLVLGGPTGENPDQNPDDAECSANSPSTCAEYSGCPNILTLNHYLDGAVDPQARNRCLPDKTCAITGQACTIDSDCIVNVCVDSKCSVSGDVCAVDSDCENTCDDTTEKCTLSGEDCGPFGSHGFCSPPTMDVRLVTEITMVPCTQDFEEGLDFQDSRISVDILMFNEFEQRLSTITTLTCFKDTALSSIETSDPERSIFSVGIGGSLTAQTRMRGIGSDAGSKPRGNALVAIAEEFRCSGPIWEFPTCNFVNPENLISSAARNVHFQGRRPVSDYIYLPLQ